MKVGPVNKLDKRNKTTSNKCDASSCRKIVTPLPFFQFTTNLEQSGRRIPDAYSVKLVFSLIVIFRLTETKNRTKKSLNKSRTIALNKVLFWPRNADFLQKC